MCFVQFVNFGVRSGGGVGDIMEAPDWNTPNSGFRIIYDSSFFIIVIVILLNIIFGIIIDTFGELRTKADSINEDVKNTCFICGIDRQEFDRNSSVGFEHHILHEHHIWNYLAFNMYLRRKEKTEYTGPEQIISEMITDQNWRFIPHMRALSVTYPNEDDENNKDLENVLEKLKELGTKHSTIEDHLQQLSNRIEIIENKTHSDTEEELMRVKTQSQKIEALTKYVKNFDTRIEKLMTQVQKVWQVSHKTNIL